MANIVDLAEMLHFVILQYTINLNSLNLVLFVGFDSLRPINNLSVIEGRVFLG